MRITRTNPDLDFSYSPMRYLFRAMDLPGERYHGYTIVQVSAGKWRVFGLFDDEDTFPTREIARGAIRMFGTRRATRDKVRKILRPR